MECKRLLLFKLHWQINFQTLKKVCQEKVWLWMLPRDLCHALLRLRLSTRANCERMRRGEWRMAAADYYRVKRDLVADKDGFRMDRRFLNEQSFGIVNISPLKYIPAKLRFSFSLLLNNGRAQNQFGRMCNKTLGKKRTKCVCIWVVVLAHSSRLAIEEEQRGHEFFSVAAIAKASPYSPSRPSRVFLHYCQTF